MSDPGTQDKPAVGHIAEPSSPSSSSLADNRPLTWKTTIQYLKSRIPTLKPPMRKAPNPFQALALLNRQQWLFFAVAFAGWTLDALDFFTVSLTTSELATEFNKPISSITWGITLVLMLRSIGAITFGIASDLYGRKWPFIINNILFIILEISTGFTQTYEQFLGVRALFGIAMGGLYGNAAATALEDCPVEARGIVSGLLQQGYAFGYLLATAFARALVGTTSQGWRPFYWFAGGLPVFVIVFRLCLPETEAYRERVRMREEVARGGGAEGEGGGNVSKTFVREGKVALKRHWLLLVYLVLLMVGFNFM
ncbi:major facilitator superfamily domain-containing protein, partial [Aspergillus karnatakaensis]|uniref:major facilitator superfamily domain-containing protein n=1 Tax=Aspergillus karnatakaensis TaxID=1810916 RepID=UPI003CCD189F